MASATAPLRSAAQTSLETAIAWLIELNQTRWRKPKAVSSGTDVRERNLDSLRSAVQEFRQSKHFEILEPFRDAFDGQGNFKTELLGAYKYSGRDLFRCYVFTTNLVYFSLVLIEFLELLLEIERKTPQSKFQLPTRFAQMLVKSANDSTGGTNPLDMGVKDPGHVDGDEGSTETLVEEKDVEKGKTKKVKVYGMSHAPTKGIMMRETLLMGCSQRPGRQRTAQQHPEVRPALVKALGRTQVPLRHFRAQICNC
jgi:hypothetical protein